MVIATVRNFKQEVVYTSQANSLGKVYYELHTEYPSDKFLLTLNEEGDRVFIDGRRGGGTLEAELTPVTFD